MFSLLPDFQFLFCSLILQHCFDVDLITTVLIFCGSFCLLMKEVCKSKAANVSLQCLCVFSDNTMLFKKFFKKAVTPGTFVSLNLDSRVHVWSCVKSLKQLCLLSVETDVSLLLCL